MQLKQQHILIHISTMILEKYIMCILYYCIMRNLLSSRLSLVELWVGSFPVQHHLRHLPTLLLHKLHFNLLAMIHCHLFIRRSQKSASASTVNGAGMVSFKDLFLFLPLRLIHQSKLVKINDALVSTTILQN